MLAPHAFFSFTSVPDVRDHHAYNEWHQLDHRPENLALDGVRHGERWVRTPRAAETSVADSRLAPTHYVNLYWFRPPIDRSVAEWQALAERSFQWGRRPDMALCTRPLMGFFDVVRCVVAPRLRLSPAALPFRPSRGVIVQVLSLDEPHSILTEALYRWDDSIAVPTALGVPGVAGVATFVSVTSTIDDGFDAPADARTFAPGAAAQPGALRVTVTWCDDDVHETFARLQARLAGARASASVDPVAAAAATILFDSPLEVIEPWRWDWFAGAAVPTDQ